MPGNTIIILGGGVGGIITANSLREQLSPEHRIIVVDKTAEYVFTPSLLWVMVGWRNASRISKDLRRLLHAGIEVIQAEANEIDLDNQRVKTSNGDLAYDYLVLALGADLVPEALPGFQEAALTPYDLDGATRLWSALQSFEGGRIAVLVSALPYKCPAAPYETAMLLDDHLRRQGIRERCEIEVYTPEVLPMGVAGPGMGQAVVGMLVAKGIRFNPELDVKHIDASQKQLVFTNHEPVTFDLLAGVPPHRPPQVMAQSPVANEGGWVLVDKRTLQTTYESVYAIGDVAAITLSNGKPLPKAGVFADGQARTVANRISDDIQGSGARAEFDGLGFCWIETGGGSAGFAYGDFYAEPDPVVPLPRSGRIWHWGKILYEEYWLGEGVTQGISKFGLKIGTQIYNIPAPL